MRTTFLSATLAVSTSVSALPALPQGIPGLSDVTNMIGDVVSTATNIIEQLAPALPLEKFNTKKFTTLFTPEDIINRVFEKNDTATPEASSFHTLDTASAAATCSNPRVRIEWDSYSNSDRQAYITAIKCLQSRGPSGQFSQSKSRYEDLVALHQTLTPNVHGNAKFLLWHRYYTWMFEDILRSECGFDRAIPWFDETRYAGNFAASSIFSDQWYGGINANGNCITNGQFANLAINVGPGTDNYAHCLARNNDNSKTQYCSADMVNGCNNENDYANMASCTEGGAHAWGHNGIGAVMQDVYGSPGDPVFFLHHAFIDRNFRIWQNKDPATRTTTIDGRDGGGNPLTLDTTVNVYGMRPDVRIRDILDTTSTTLCYKYNY